jgi:hypothetical protein
VYIQKQPLQRPMFLSNREQHTPPNNPHNLSLSDTNRTGSTNRGSLLYNENPYTPWIEEFRKLHYTSQLVLVIPSVLLACYLYTQASTKIATDAVIRQLKKRGYITKKGSHQSEPVQNRLA